MDSGDSIIYPGTDIGMAVLTDGVVVGTGGDEGNGWIDAAEVEEMVA